MKRDNFSPNNKEKTPFIGESWVDLRGPQKEMWLLFVQQFPQLGDFLSNVYDFYGVGTYRSVGQGIAMTLVHKGNAPFCFLLFLYQVVTTTKSPAFI